jgi:hypothetical protein
MSDDTKNTPPAGENAEEKRARLAAEKLAEKEAREAAIKAKAEEKAKAKIAAENAAQAKAEADAEAAALAKAKIAGPGEKFLGPDAVVTKLKLAAEPQVRFYIPLMPGEKKGAEETITINGYQRTIKKGVFMNLPESMANTLAEYYHIEMTAGEKMLVDRVDVKDGVSIETALG